MTSGVRGPKPGSTPFSRSTTLRFMPAGVCAMPATSRRPSSPPTHSGPLVIIRMTSGCAAAGASVVIGVKGRSGPASVPASTASAASGSESAPEPLPPIRQMAALPRM